MSLKNFDMNQPFMCKKFKTLYILVFTNILATMEKKKKNPLKSLIPISKYLTVSSMAFLDLIFF